MGRKKKLASISGAWYQPENSGWGVLITEHQNNRITATTFTYDNRGSQLWLNGAGDRNENGDVSVELYKPSGRRAFSELTNFQLGEIIGSLNLYLDGEDLSFEVSVRSDVIEPPPNFSPALPPTFTYTGKLVKI